MSVVTKTYYCSKHPSVEVGQERETVVYTGLYDNGEDYATETDSDFWPCLACEEEEVEEIERKMFAADSEE